MLFAFPSSGIGATLGLPDPTPHLYNTLCALFVGLFGAAYVWLARQPHIDRPLVAFAAITKASVFTVFLIFWLKGVVTTPGLLMVVPHLVVAVLFGRWLQTEKPQAEGNRS
jgi:uncharacterized membrane protein YfcA